VRKLVGSGTERGGVGFLEVYIRYLIGILGTNSLERKRKNPL
jgi:hypothetical protein